jgi:hypothetical protein
MEVSIVKRYLGLVLIAACGHALSTPGVASVQAKVKLAVIPAESDQFPAAAKAASESMASAHVGGIDEMQISKVSLEVVQLSIECVDPTVACYQAIGRSLSANRLLFAQITAGDKPRQLRMTVTLFDVDTQLAKRTAEKVFASEDDATAGTAQLVAEATRP